MLKGDLASDAGTSSKQELLNYKPDAYRIGANDLLYITVWDHPELTAPSGPQQQLDANGRLVAPMAPCSTRTSAISKPRARPLKNCVP